MQVQFFRLFVYKEGQNVLLNFLWKNITFQQKINFTHDTFGNIRPKLTMLSIVHDLYYKLYQTGNT